MKQILVIALLALAPLAAGAQTLNVHVAGVTYLFPASQTGDMVFSQGTSLTLMGRTFALADIDDMTIDDTPVTDNLVTVAYSGSSATVTVAGNAARYVSPAISGAHVEIATSNTEAVDGDELTIQLAGSSDDGSLTLSGSYKTTLSLAGLQLANPSGAAISIANSKRIQVSVKKDTRNTLSDGANGSQKACLYSKGQLQLQGGGTLTVQGNTKHAIKSASYIGIKNLTLNIASAVGDGINCEEYFWLMSGSVTIGGVGDDGIQCDLGGDSSTGQTDGHEDEDTGNIYLEGGTLSVTATADASKGIKAAGSLIASAGTVSVTASGGGAYDSDQRDAKGAACLKADGDMAISGGTFTLRATGAGGKCIKADGTFTLSDGTVQATSTGSQYRYSSSATASPKAVKSEGAMTLSGGTLVASSSSHEGVETKSTLDITGGDICITASDDAINAASHLTISGGYVMANSTGNDGIDANGNLYIKGGNVFAIATSSPEVGLDANTEGGYALYISGGNVASIGGLEGGCSISNGSAYQASSYSKGTWYALLSGNAAAFAFKVPSNSRMGTPLSVYTSGTATLLSGVSGSGTALWDGNGYTGYSGGSSVSLSTYSGGGSGPGGGGNPGGGGGPGGGGPGGGGRW